MTILINHLPACQLEQKQTVLRDFEKHQFMERIERIYELLEQINFYDNARLRDNAAFLLKSTNSLILNLETDCEVDFERRIEELLKEPTTITITTDEQWEKMKADLLG